MGHEAFMHYWASKNKRGRKGGGAKIIIKYHQFTVI
jgi:hypothetical protein